MLTKISDTFLTNIYGRFRFITYKDGVGKYYYVFSHGEIRNKNNVFCRVHSACVTAETFFATNCDCREQLINAFISCQQLDGLIIYLPQEGRGNGIEAKLKQIELEEKTQIDIISAYKIIGYPLESRTYKEAAEIIKDLKIKSININTANPHKIEELKKYGIEITQRTHPKVKDIHPQAEKNLKAKQNSLNYFEM